ERVAAVGRNGDAVENRAEARLGEERVVRVPADAEARRLARRLEHAHQLRDVVGALDDRVDVELAEAAREVDLLGVRQPLLAEADYAGVDEGALDRGEGPVVEPLGEVEAADLGAQRTRQGAYFDLRVGHWLRPPLL